MVPSSSRVILGVPMSPAVPYGCGYEWRYVSPTTRMMAPMRAALPAISRFLFRDPQVSGTSLIGRIRPLSTAVGRANAFLHYASGCAAHACPIEHFHVGDPTCRPGGSGPELGAQNGPHYHEGSPSCYAEARANPNFYRTLGYAVCERPHHHVGDPSWRPANGG